MNTRMMPLALLALAACHKTPPPPPPVVDASAPVEAGVADAAVAAPVLHRVLGGACPDMRVDLVGTTPVLSGGREAWALESPPRRLHRLPDAIYDRLEGRQVGASDRVLRAGGLDIAHAWLELEIEGSMGRQRGNEIILASAPDRGFRTPHGSLGFYSITNVVPQPDGEVWAFGEHSIYLDIPGDEKVPEGKSHDRYFAWGPGGAPVERHLPGSDMGHGRRLANGEIVADGTRVGDQAKLLRWSPTRKVDDLVGPLVAKTKPTLLVGTTRAVLLLDPAGPYLDYTGADALAPGKMAPSARTLSWMLTPSDELWTTTQDAELWIETRDGTVTKEMLPARGVLVNDGGTPWLQVLGGGLLARVGKTWTKVEVPGHIEWVRSVGDETFVSTDLSSRFANLVRRAPDARALYATRPHPGLGCADPALQHGFTFAPTSSK